MKWRGSDESKTGKAISHKTVLMVAWAMFILVFAQGDGTIMVIGIIAGTATLGLFAVRYYAACRRAGRTPVYLAVMILAYFGWMFSAGLAPIWGLVSLLFFTGGSLAVLMEPLE